MSAIARVTLLSSLPGACSRDTEAAVQQAFAGAKGGPWTVHLALSENREAWWSVKVVCPGHVFAIAVSPDDQHGEPLRRRLTSLLSGMGWAER